MKGEPSAKVAPAPSAAPIPAVPKATPNPEGFQQVELARVKPCAFQPRRTFSDESIDELADSIRVQGLLQPLVVRSVVEGFELIAGERRWRASHKAGLILVPVIVMVADDRKVLELALIENLQRENLNPIDEATGYSQLATLHGLTQEDIARQLGKKRATVANAMRLLSLPEEAKILLRDGAISAGHAKVILGLPETDQVSLARRVVEEKLSVRQTEEIAAQWQAAKTTAVNGKAATHTAVTHPDTHVVDLQNKLQERLGTKVLLRYRKGVGAVEIRFFTDDDLERLLALLGVNAD